MSSFTPCVVLDLETTGFLLKQPAPDGWNARVIEVGAVVVTSDLNIVSPISPLVRQPADHLYHPRSRRAARVHRIPPAAILMAPHDAEEAAERLAAWLTAVRERFGARELRGWGQAFDFRFLSAEPWSIFERTGFSKGEDVQRVFKRAVGKRSGGLGGAVAARGLRNPSAHRALADARATAEVLIACQQMGAAAEIRR